MGPAHSPVDDVLVLFVLFVLFASASFLALWGRLPAAAAAGLSGLVASYLFTTMDAYLV